MNDPRVSFGLTEKSIVEPMTGCEELYSFMKNALRSERDLTIELFPELLHPTRKVKGDISTVTPFLSKTRKFLIV